MDDTSHRRYIVMGEGAFSTGESLDEARAHFRTHRADQARVIEPVRIPVNVEPEKLFDGERFFEALCILHDVRHPITH